MDELKCSILFKLDVEESAVADDDLAYTVLFKQEGVGSLVLFSIFIAKVLKQDGLLADSFRVKVLQGLVECAAQLFKRTPHVRTKFSCEYLPRIGLST